MARAMVLSQARHLAQLHRSQPRLEGLRRIASTEPLQVSAVDTKLVLAPSAGTVSSVSTITFVAASGTYGALYVLAPELPGVTFSDAQGALTSTPVGQGIHEVTLRQALSAGGSATLTVSAAGAPSCGGGVGGGIACQVNTTLTFSMSARWHAVGISGALDALLTPASAKLSVTVPDPVVVAASGVQTGKQANADQTTTYSFVNDTNGLFALSAAPFSVGQTAFGAGKQIGSYLLGPAASAAAAWRDAMKDIMSYHIGRYGPYEASKIDITQVPDAVGAAFGPFSTIFMPDSLVAQSPLDWQYTTTLAHELAHQWFGNMIDLADNSSAWLNEGFATFAEMEYTITQASKDFGIDYGPTYRNYHKQLYIYGIPVQADLPISSMQVRQAPLQIYYVLTYKKGAMVLGMIRHALGGNAELDKALKRYRLDHLGTRGATLQSLAASVKAATGKDIAPLLSEWASKAGYPTYSIGVERSKVGAKHRLTLTVDADRDFHVPEEVEIVGADGTRTRKRIEADGKQQTLVVDSDVEPIFVNFDPDKQLVCLSRGALEGDVILNGAVDGTDLIYAAWAVGQQAQSQQQQTNFADWADLVFDGKVDQSDLDRVTNNFGKRSGAGS
ncbi:MAG: hypothetical protein KC503_23400 [Myxococcales bacterium]|nr:hypothetical protein [Myxococcales bacterium]